jgi:hypothetical protein
VSVYSPMVRQGVGLGQPDTQHDGEHEYPCDADAPPGEDVGGEVRAEGDPGVSDDSRPHDGQYDQP